MINYDKAVKRTESLVESFRENDEKKCNITVRTSINDRELMRAMAKKHRMSLSGFLIYKAFLGEEVK